MNPESPAGQARYRIIEVSFPDKPAEFYISDHPLPPYLTGELLVSFASEAEARAWWSDSPPGGLPELSQQVLQVSHSTEKDTFWAWGYKSIAVKFNLPLDEFTDRIGLGFVRGRELEAFREELQFQFIPDKAVADFFVEVTDIEELTCLARSPLQSEQPQLTIRALLEADIHSLDYMVKDTYMDYLKKYFRINVQLPALFTESFPGEFTTPSNG